MSGLRFVVTGGGTGGHIYPALAIAGGLARTAEAEILYMGGKDSTEERLAAKAGFDFIGVETCPLHRKSLAIFKDLAANRRGSKEAAEILRRCAPQVVFGTGGYASWPVMKAAVKLGIHTMIHEQNAAPGLSNRNLAKNADKICLTFAAAGELFAARHRHKIEITGLPVRPSIIEAQRDQARECWQIGPSEPVLVVTGGSQGAASINTAMSGAWKPLLADGLFIIHITGEKKYEAMKAAAKDQGLAQEPRLHLMPYLHEMEKGLAAADLVVGRSGASFLAEILCRGLPSILVPYPYAAANHQLLNAEAVEKAGGALLIEDKDLSAQSLTQAVRNLFTDREKMLKMSAAASGLGKPQALQHIIDIALRLAKR